MVVSSFTSSDFLVKTISLKTVCLNNSPPETQRLSLRIYSPLSALIIYTCKPLKPCQILKIYF